MCITIGSALLAGHPNAQPETPHQASPPPPKHQVLLGGEVGQETAMLVGTSGKWENMEPRKTFNMGESEGSSV